jgi:hypothetical protein
MKPTGTLRSASVGVVENANSAVFVTVSPEGKLLDRRHVVLTPPDLPTHPHHHEGSWAVGRYLNTPGARRVTIAEAITLVDRVRDAAERGAREAIDKLAMDVAMPIGSMAIRACPELPATTEERIRDNRAQTYADSVMYRRAIALAAEARGWSVHWYDREHVLRDADDSFLREMGRLAGPPWQASHRLAAAAAIAAS